MPIVDERHEINKVINELEKEGVSLDNIDEMTGLGDVVEGVLIKFGVTEERFKKWFKDRKSTRLNSSHSQQSRMPSSA